MVLSSKIEFRMVTLADENKVVEHVYRNRKEAGRDGDTIFGFGSLEPFDEDGWRKRFRENNNCSLESPGWTRILLATDGEHIIGGVSLKTEKLHTSLHRASLAIVVEKEYRGHGLGRRLMSMIIEWSRTQTRLEWIDLEVFATNPRAHTLYKSLGFVEWGRCQDRFRVDNKPIDDISMSLKLHP